MTLRITTIGFLVMVLMTACGGRKNETNTCSTNKQDTLGKIIVTLPECYNVVFPDKDNYPTNGLIVIGNSTKLEFSTDGLGSILPITELQKDKSVKQQIDTINKHFLRQIAYFSKEDKYELIINIVDLDTTTTTFLDKLGKYNWKLKAGTRNTALTKEELELLTNSFKNCKIAE